MKPIKPINVFAPFEKQGQHRRIFHVFVNGKGDTGKTRDTRKHKGHRKTQRDTEDTRGHGEHKGHRCDIRGTRDTREQRGHWRHKGHRGHKGT